MGAVNEMDIPEKDNALDRSIMDNGRINFIVLVRILHILQMI